MKKLLLSFYVVFSLSTTLFAQTTLSPGDIAITGANCDNPDDFSFLLLVDIEAGTVIKFTDNGWFAAGGFRSGEGIQTYTAPSALAAGTTIIFSTSSADFTPSGSFALAAAGDQLLAYQGDEATPTHIYALNIEGSHVWQADATSSNTSALPTGLTNGTNAVAVEEFDNVMYSGSTTFASPAEALSAISNYINWTGDNAIRYDLTALGDFTLPVELTSFTARAGDSRVTLRWSTASEMDNQGFIIIRSADKNGEYDIVDSYTTNNNLKGAGSSSEAHDYTFIDNSVFNGVTYWYKLVDVDMNGTRTAHGPVYCTPHAGEITLDPVNSDLPTAFTLHQNHPNPFNPGTTINFDIPDTKKGLLNVKLTVYDLLGKKVKILANGPLTPGPYQVKWNGINDAGQLAPSGIYIYHFESELFSAAKKMILMK